MDPLSLRELPEQKIRAAIIKYLEARQWYVVIIIGNKLQMGLPDLFIAHQNFGQRWVEIKNPEKYSFTRAQKENFPRMVAHGVGVWIMTEATDREYEVLFKPYNLYKYWGHTRRQY